MSTLMDELTAIKAVEDKLTANKVANFAYTDHAYNNPLTEADGVASYDPDAEQNIPNANASTLQVNSTILTKGWRAQASSITRMLMNHFLGRCSYNLNKINDLFSTLLTKLMAYMETPNGLATLNSEGKVVALNNVVNTGDSATPTENGTDKFTTGGAYALQQACAPKDHSSTTTDYGVATDTKYGHVKTTSVFKETFTDVGGHSTQLGHQLSKDIEVVYFNNCFRNRLTFSYPSGAHYDGILIEDNTVKIITVDSTVSQFDLEATAEMFILFRRGAIFNGVIGA